MKSLICFVFVVLMISCGGEEPKVDELVCQMMFDCYKNPTVSSLSPDYNPFETLSDCQKVVNENVKFGDTDCLMKLDACDVLDDDKIVFCLTYY